MTMSSQKSSFPISLGIRVTGVDDSTFSQTGESFSAITMPNADTHVARSLQQDDTALAYEFVSDARPVNEAHCALTLPVHRGRPANSPDTLPCASYPLRQSNNTTLQCPS